MRSLALLGALTALIWLAVGLLFFIVGVWFRDDDWLAAGFLLGVTLLLSGWTADVVAESITKGSLVPVLFAAPGMLLGVALRGIISVPELGGVVALLRWLTRLIRPGHPQPVHRLPNDSIVAAAVSLAVFLPIHVYGIAGIAEIRRLASDGSGSH